LGYHESTTGVMTPGAGWPPPWRPPLSGGHHATRSPAPRATRIRKSMAVPVERPERNQAETGQIDRKLTRPWDASRGKARNQRPARQRWANHRPRMPPAPDITAPSVTDCRKQPPRGWRRESSAQYKLTSCVTRREAITKFARFAQTMSSTNPTAACRTQNRPAGTPQRSRPVTPANWRVWSIARTGTVSWGHGLSCRHARPSLRRMRSAPSVAASTVTPPFQFAQRRIGRGPRVCRGRIRVEPERQPNLGVVIHDVGPGWHNGNDFRGGRPLDFHLLSNEWSSSKCCFATIRARELRSGVAVASRSNARFSSSLKNRPCCGLNTERLEQMCIDGDRGAPARGRSPSVTLTSPVVYAAPPVEIKRQPPRTTGSSGGNSVVLWRQKGERNFGVPPLAGDSAVRYISWSGFWIVEGRRSSNSMHDRENGSVCAPIPSASVGDDNSCETLDLFAKDRNRVM